MPLPAAKAARTSRCIIGSSPKNIGNVECKNKYGPRLDGRHSCSHSMDMSVSHSFTLLLVDGGYSDRHCEFKSHTNRCNGIIFTKIAFPIQVTRCTVIQCQFVLERTSIAVVVVCSWRRGLFWDDRSKMLPGIPSALHRITDCLTSGLVVVMDVWANDRRRRE